MTSTAATPGAALATAGPPTAGPPTARPPSVLFPARPTVLFPARPTRRPLEVRLLVLATCAVVALSPVEGYLMEVHPQLSKLPTVLFAGAWLLVRVRERRFPRLHGAHLLLAGLAVVVLASTAVHLDQPYALEYAIRWVPFLALAALLIDVVGREVPGTWLLASMVAGAVAAGIGALFSVLVLGEPRATGPLEDPNDLAYVLVVALPLVLALAPSGSPRRRLGLGAVLLAAAAVLAVGAAVTLSRGGAFALAAAVAVLAARRVLAPRVLVAAAALAVVGAGLLVLVAPEQVDRALDEKASIAGTNIDTRELRWQAAARMLAGNPLLGVGPGGFRAEYAAASHVAELAEQTPVAHSMYLEVAAELGLPGLLLFLGVLAAGLVAAERALRTGADRRTAVTVQAGIVAALVASVFLSEQYYLSLWCLVALACGLELRRRQRSVR